MGRHESLASQMPGPPLGAEARALLQAKLSAARRVSGAVSRAQEDRSRLIPSRRGACRLASTPSGGLV